ncbi:LIPA.2 family protein [Megaselia abdita]
MKSFTLCLLALAAVANSTPIDFEQPQIESRGLFTMRTPEIVRNDGFPLESHKVQTSDGYILEMFRIPYSPNLRNEGQPKKVAFLMHGLLSSSDCWILNGAENSMAYILSNAGYDVWMGNARGNTYSRANVKKSPLLPPFWDFSWNEIAMYDMPAMFDYVRYVTGVEKFHYAGHSQGTTVYFVLCSTVPKYNDLFESAHLLAPVGFMNHMQSPLAKVGGPLLGKPSLLSKLIGSNEFMPSNEFMGLLGDTACRNKSPFQEICGNVLFLIAGWDSQHLNYTALPLITATHPAGSSTSQLIHYLQEYESGYFRRYDYGKSKNKKLYGQKEPTNYNVENIDAKTYFYYGDNDYFAAVSDVLRMALKMKNLKLYYQVPIPQWNHLDFLWAINVKEMINDRVKDNMLALD